MKTTWFLGALLAASAIVGPSAAQAATKFEFWYGLSGDLSDRIQDVCKRFNESQKDFEAVCVGQDNYDNNLQNTIAAYRANKQPTITQIHDAGTLDLMLSGATMPVGPLLADNGYKVDFDAYVPGIRSYFSTSKGELQSLPFNNSTAMMYYNTDALAKVGFTGLPQTWEDVEDVATKMKAAGYDCPIAFDPTGVWQWFEQFSAIHNQPIATLNNGYGGLGAEVVFNKTKFVDQLTWIKKMYDAGVIVNKSKAAGETANDAFMNGKCQITSSSIADHGTFTKQAQPSVHWQVAMLPVWKGTERKNSFVGGASLWVLKGKSADEYKGAAAFLNFIAQPDSIEYWSTVTGYIPVTTTAFDAMKAKGFYDDPTHKGRELAIESLSMPAGDNSKGIRLGNYVSIRKEVADAISKVLFDNVPVQQALDDAAARANAILRKYEQTYQGVQLP